MAGSVGNFLAIFEGRGWLFRPLLWACLALGTACGSGSDKPEIKPIVLDPPAPRAESTAYHYRALPFSATLGKIFSNGQIVVIPGFSPVAGRDSTDAEDYAFSAVDGLGRVYHFFQSGRWEAAPTTPLSRPLPKDNWRVQWNSHSRCLELLCTASIYGIDRVTFLRMLENEWEVVPTDQTPAAGQGMYSVLEPASGAWFVINREATGVPSFQRLDAEHWDTIVSDDGPDLSHVLRLIAYPPQSGLALLTSDNDIWLWSEGQWSREVEVAAEDCRIFHFDPPSNRILMGFGSGPGRTRLMKILLARGGASQIEPVPVTDSMAWDRVTINDQIDGYWEEIGHIQPSAPPGDASDQEILSGLRGVGESSLTIATAGGPVQLAAREIRLLDLAPQLDSILTGCGVYVPGMEGYVEVSNQPTGIEFNADVPFPYVGASSADHAGASDARAAVRRRHSRFWLFTGSDVDWLDSFPEIHPDLDFQYLSSNPGTQTNEYLSWIYPEEGVFQYRYRRQSPENVQWLDSPPLTLRQIPEDGLQPSDKFWLLDPVTWNDPPEVVQAGWIGALGDEIKSLSTDDDTEQHAYRSVPRHGFFARTSALAPDQWIADPLPIPFGVDVRLVSNPIDEELYLVGGRVAIQAGEENDRHFVMTPNREVWLWRGGDWEKLDPFGPAPDYQFEFAAAYDPFRKQLLVLQSHALFALNGGRWRLEWAEPSDASSDKGRQLGIYVHPRTGQVIGAWSGIPLKLGVLKDGRWSWIKTTKFQEQTALAISIDRPGDLIPSVHDDGFYIIDSKRIAPFRSANPLLLGPIAGFERFASQVRLIPAQ